MCVEYKQYELLTHRIRTIRVMKLDTKYTKTVLYVYSTHLGTCLDDRSTMCASTVGGTEAAASRRGRNRPAAGIQRDRLIDGGPAAGQDIRHERHESVRIASSCRAAATRHHRQQRGLDSTMRHGRAVAAQATYGRPYSKWSRTNNPIDCSPASQRDGRLVECHRYACATVSASQALRAGADSAPLRPGPVARHRAVPSADAVAVAVARRPPRQLRQFDQCPASRCCEWGRHADQFGGCRRSSGANRRQQCVQTTDVADESGRYVRCVQHSAG